MTDPNKPRPYAGSRPERYRSSWNQPSAIAVLVLVLTVCIPVCTFFTRLALGL